MFRHTPQRSYIFLRLDTFCWLMCCALPPLPSLLPPFVTEVLHAPHYTLFSCLRMLGTTSWEYLATRL